VKASTVTLVGFESPPQASFETFESDAAVSSGKQSMTFPSRVIATEGVRIDLEVDV
jgi:hypothetical protein